MSRFSECLVVVLEFEGGYSNDPADHGGATKCGITQAVYDDYRIRHGLGRNPITGIARNEIDAIYQTNYWNRILGDRLPRGIDIATFDSVVNHGVVQGSKFLQRALGVSDDGIIGDKTIAAALKDQRSGMSSHVIADILDQRIDFYQRLAERDKTQKKFLNGWINRIEKLRKVAYGA